MMFRTALALLMLASPAAANELQCYQRSEFIAALAENYGEVQVMRAMEDRGLMVEAYVSESGTWTIAVMQADLATCILATGTRWMMIAPGVEG